MKIQYILATLFNIRSWLRHTTVEAYCRDRWFMGHAYFDYMSGRQVVILVPFNFLWRWWHWIEHQWLKHVCCGRSWIDEHVEHQTKQLKEDMESLWRRNRELEMNAIIYQTEYGDGE